MGFAICGLACQGQANTPGPTTGRAVSFSSEIQPIFNDLCIGCHVTGGFADQQGIPLRLIEGLSFAMLINQKSTQNPSLTLVTPGDTANSLLFLKVSSNSPPVGDTMPLIGRRLTSSELARVRDWIDQGAMNN